MAAINISYAGMDPVGINLKESFGHLYRIGLEDSHTPGSKVDPWYYIILGKHGHIYPYGHDHLCAWVEAGHPRLAKKLLQIPGTDEWQGGGPGSESAIRFDVSLHKEIFKLMKLYRKRNPSALQLQHLAKARELAKAARTERPEPNPRSVEMKSLTPGSQNEDSTSNSTSNPQNAL